MNTDDPIIAAIEAHRRACTETRAAFEHQTVVEDEIAAGARVLEGEAENNPRWIAADGAVREAITAQDDLAVRLLQIQPTTIAGAAALLTYYLDLITTKQAEVIFPELDVMGHLIESTSTNEPTRDFGVFYHPQHW